MKPDTKPRPDMKRLGEVTYLLGCVEACLKEGGQGNRGQAARCMRDAAFVLYEQAERIMDDGYKPDFGSWRLKVSADAIHAIEQVLLVNNDISQLYEKRGVAREDLREIFRLAEETARGVRQAKP